MSVLAERRLVVTADDFGAHEAVNAAVIEAHRDGVLTAASLMVAAPAAAEAVEAARTLPQLGVGLHLVLVEGAPVLPREQVDRLVGPDGNFLPDMITIALRIAFDPTARRQMQAEVEAQFDAFAATGLPLDHVNAHKHFHLHPMIGEAVIAACRKRSVRAVRLPSEPAGPLRKVEPDGGAGAGLESAISRMFRGRYRRIGVVTPDQVFGLAWSGAMTESRLAGLIDNLPPGLTEIYLHPARGPYPGSAPGYRYQEELQALTAAQVRSAAEGVQRGAFHDFAGRA